MKKIFWAALIFGLPIYAQALGWDSNIPNRSSFTATNETTATISSTTMPGGVFVGVAISSSMSNGLVTFYDSRGSATNTIGKLSLTSSGQQSWYVPFEVRVSSGLTYTTTGNTVGITIVYKPGRPN